jgi:hypothetical protein
MTGTASTRFIVCLLVGACPAFCLPALSQPASQRDGKQNSFPDAPSVQKAKGSETLRSLLDKVRQPVTTFEPADGMVASRLEPKYDPLHLPADRTPTNTGDLTAWNPSLLAPGPRFLGSTSSSLLGRATDAASSIVLTRDEEGNRKLNTQYLLRVLTMATAHVAEHTYGRRTIGQPLSDFGSTVGNDAGMNVLHEFQPGLLELVKNHEPKFVSRIEQRVHKK